MRQSARRGAVALATMCLALVLGQCRKPAADGAVYLEQGWSDHDRQTFWYTSQGSQIIRYDWFLALEQAAGTEPFRSDANMNRLGFLPQKPGSLNPDGLPIGFAKDVDAKKRSWMGWTCAACHTGQIHYGGKRIRIDGGPTLADVWSFLDELAAAMRKTAEDDLKFDHFAKKVLKSGYNEESAKVLRKELDKATKALEGRQKMDAPSHPPGPARYDAFGTIFNQTLAANLGQEQNIRQADAPVSYPCLWDAPHSDRVQWNGSVDQTQLPYFSSATRNIGQALGVFAKVEVDPQQGAKGYRSSVKVLAQVQLERKVTHLLSPLWPEEILGEIDKKKAEKGKGIYTKTCQNCHRPIQRNDPRRQAKTTMVPVQIVQTDPAMATNYIARKDQLTGPLEGARELILWGKQFGSTAHGYGILRNQVLGALLGSPWGFAEIQKIRAGNRRDALAALNSLFEAPPGGPQYKARPHNGIWATAPYLHNGSVPNLWELLQPAAKRVKVFHVGNRDFDPKHVGFESGPSAGGFKFDTTLPGNSNQGHDFGFEKLSDDDRWALIEYLKTL